MILVHRNIVDMPTGWTVSIMAYEYRDIVWDETGKRIVSSEYYRDQLLLEVEK
jgi:hypothetical protein